MQGDMPRGTGAWIEIISADIEYVDDAVAPFTGAWIEIFNMATKAVSIDRRSLRGATQIAASPSSYPTSPNLYPSQSFTRPTKTFAHVMTRVL